MPKQSIPNTDPATEPIDDTVGDEPTNDVVGGEGEVQDGDGLQLDTPVDQEADGGDVQQDAWREQFEQIGLKDIPDVETGITRLAQSYQQRNEHLQQLAETNRQLQAALRERAGGQSAQPQQAPSQVDDDDVFALPQLPPGFERFRVRKQDAEGNESWDWSDDTPPSVRESGDKYAAKVMDFQNRIQTPAGFKELLDTYVERNLMPKVEQQYETRQSASSEEQAEQQFLTENDSWFFELDAATGQPMIDPMTGDRRISLEGRKFQKIMTELADDGVTSFQKRLQLAHNLYSREREAVQQQPSQQRQVAATANVAAKKQMLGRRATPNTSRAPQQQPAAGDPSPQPRQGYGVQLLENLRANGVQLE